MNVIPVKSSALVAVGYDDESELLQLDFGSCEIYQYFAVPVGKYQALLAAESKGSYFNQAIRGRYPFVRITGGTGTRANSRPAAGARGAAWPAR